MLERSGKAVSAVIPGLAARGTWWWSASASLRSTSYRRWDYEQPAGHRSGHASGASIGSQDTLVFNALSGVRPTRFALSGNYPFDGQKCEVPTSAVERPGYQRRHHYRRTSMLIASLRSHDGKAPMSVVAVTLAVCRMQPFANSAPAICQSSSGVSSACSRCFLPSA